MTARSRPPGRIDDGARSVRRIQNTALELKATSEARPEVNSDGTVPKPPRCRGPDVDSNALSFGPDLDDAVAVGLTSDPQTKVVASRSARRPGDVRQRMRQLELQTRLSKTGDVDLRPNQSTRPKLERLAGAGAVVTKDAGAGSPRPRPSLSASGGPGDAGRRPLDVEAIGVGLHPHGRRHEARLNLFEASRDGNQAQEAADGHSVGVKPNAPAHPEELTTANVEHDRRRLLAVIEGRAVAAANQRGRSRGAKVDLHLGAHGVAVAQGEVEPLVIGPVLNLDGPSLTRHGNLG